MRWSTIFLVIALASSVFGFGDILDDAADIAIAIFIIFILLFLMAFIKETRDPPSSKY